VAHDFVAARSYPQMAARGVPGFLITPTGSLVPQREKGNRKMKAIILMAAVLTSALLTVPTVTSVADARVSDLRLNA
jgi:hypothetical protein